jgi:hypothetical protein
MRLSAGVLLGFLLCATQPHLSSAQAGPSPLSAPAPQLPLPPKAVVLVMESGGGVLAATELRSALNRQPRVRVLSLAEAAKQRVQPAAVLTVATDPSHIVSVVYWGLSGESDALTSPAPASGEQIGVVVVALASALLERHRLELSGTESDRIGQLRFVDFARTSREFYAMLGRFGRLSPRTSVELRLEDF